MKVAKLLRVVYVDDCNTCPFNYDTIECRLVSGDPAPPGVTFPTHPDFDADDRPRRGKRPDWCPLDRGGEAAVRARQ